MQIEAGKYYRTRDGRKVGPMAINVNGATCGEFGDTLTGWYLDGMRKSFDQTPRDLIAEWQDEPAPVDFAALAAQHRIKITVQVGDALIEYDGRE